MYKEPGSNFDLVTFSKQVAIYLRVFVCLFVCLAF